MKFIKYVSKIATLEKEIGKDIRNSDKSKFTNEQLELQILKGEIIGKYVRKISIIVLIWQSLIFFISMIGIAIYFFITKNDTNSTILLTLVSSIIFFIFISYSVFMDRMISINIGINNARNRIICNHRNEER